jgi:hypothetical protein
MMMVVVGLEVQSSTCVMMIMMLIFIIISIIIAITIIIIINIIIIITIIITIIIIIINIFIHRFSLIFAFFPGKIVPPQLFPCRNIAPRYKTTAGRGGTGCEVSEALAGHCNRYDHDRHRVIIATTITNTITNNTIVIIIVIVIIIIIDIIITIIIIIIIITHSAALWVCCSTMHLQERHPHVKYLNPKHSNQKPVQICRAPAAMVQISTRKFRLKFEDVVRDLRFGAEVQLVVNILGFGFGF